MSDERPVAEGVEPELPEGEARPEPEGLADHSVLLRGRLIAYLWRREAGGVLKRTTRGAEPICDVPFGEVRSFDSQTEQILVELVEKSKSADAFLFKLGMEEFEVEAGQVEPSARIRRF